MTYSYVFWGIDPTTTINARNGIQINPTVATVFAANNPGYALETTDPSCTCETPETWMTFTTTTPGTYTLTIGSTVVVGVVYGPIPPFRPK